MVKAAKGTVGIRSLSIRKEKSDFRHLLRSTRYYFYTRQIILFHFRQELSTNSKIAIYHRSSRSSTTDDTTIQQRREISDTSGQKCL